jgi:hypothetical protein
MVEVLTAIHKTLGFPNLDFWIKIAQVITSVSVVVAVIDYLTRRWQSRTKHAAEQIGFFNDKVIPRFDDLFVYLKAEAGSPNFTLPRVKLDNPDFKYLANNISETKLQKDILTSHDKAMSLSTNLLNALEQFAVCIEHYQIKDHEALSTVKASYVMSVEVVALALISHKDWLSGNNAYAYVLNLYMEWKDSVDRLTPEERVKKLFPG